jgi:hypothetical protein
VVLQFDSRNNPHFVRQEGSMPFLDRTLAELEDEARRTQRVLGRNPAWTGQINANTVLCVPRVVFLRTAMLYHIYHRRGQLSVYLFGAVKPRRFRPGYKALSFSLGFVAVPSIYGPSADENPFIATAAA